VWEFLKNEDLQTVIATAKDNVMSCRTVFKRLTFNNSGKSILTNDFAV